MKEHLKSLLQTAVDALKRDDELASDIAVNIQIERTRGKEHGDFATNLAMVLAKPAGKKPRDLAELILQHLPKSPMISNVVIAGPGFLNFFLTKEAFLAVVPEVLATKEQYGLPQIGNKKRINIEFVSANPTGPLHVGHGRGAAYGATLADLLAACGYAVHREYYINDAGRQMDIVAVSVWLRYLELFAAEFAFPSNAYKGDYVKTIAQALQKQCGDKLIRSVSTIFQEIPADAAPDGTGDKEAHIDALIMRAQELLSKEDYRVIFDLALAAITEDIRQDLTEFGVTFQEWFSERSMVESGAIQHAIEVLQKGGHLYQKEGATWFHSTAFGDDKDRVLIRENGQTTYFASDVAYLLNKVERGFEELFYIVGSDHHGYFPRLKAAAAALGIDTKKIHPVLVQFAVLYRGTERVQMSTRSGSFVTLRELRDEVGKDAARFFYVTRKTEQHMDFDLELAKSQSTDNPVYYIQYANARICSVFRQLNEKSLVWNKEQGLQSLAHLTTDHEKALLADLARFEEVVEAAALAYEPHQVSNYLREIAHDFHTYYNAQQFLVADEALRNARLCLVAAVQQVLINGLNLLGVTPLEIM